MKIMENEHINSTNKIHSEQIHKTKQILYKYIEQQGDYIKKLIHIDSKSAFQKIISACYDDVININDDIDKNLGDFIEGTLHYLLTSAMIPSQRKITYDSVYLDIVIPNIKELKNPKNSLIIFISKTRNVLTIKHHLNLLKKIQPNNIWIISNQVFSHNYKQYNININKNSVSEIIENIKYFIRNRHTNKFKIMSSI